MRTLRSQMMQLDGIYHKLTLFQNGFSCTFLLLHRDHVSLSVVLFKFCNKTYLQESDCYHGHGQIAPKTCLHDGPPTPSMALPAASEAQSWYQPPWVLVRAHEALKAVLAIQSCRTPPSLSDAQYVKIDRFEISTNLQKNRFDRQNIKT